MLTESVTDNRRQKSKLDVEVESPNFKPKKEQTVNMLRKMYWMKIKEESRPVTLNSLTGSCFSLRYHRKAHSVLHQHASRLGIVLLELVRDRSHGQHLHCLR